MYYDGRKMTKLINRVVIINNRRTSVRLCNKEWRALEEICGIEHVSKNEILSFLEEQKCNTLGLTYSARVFMIEYFKRAATREGHHMANHGLEDNFASLKEIIKKAIND